MPVETLFLIGAGSYLLSKANRKQTDKDRLIVGETGLLMSVIQSNDARIVESEIHTLMESYTNIFPWKHQFDSFIYALCTNKYSRLTPAVIKAIIKQESNFDPKAIRDEPHIQDASIGVMQILVKTARQVAPFPEMGNDKIRLALTQPFLNIVIGTKYLAGQFKRYNEDYEKAIAAYNAGSAIIAKSTGDFINRTYVDSVLSYTQRYANDFPIEVPHT